MDEFSEWQECQIVPSQGMEVPSVHDNFVTALSIDLEQGTLILKTLYQEMNQRKEQTDLRFTGVSAHYFNDIVALSILFDVECTTLRSLLSEWEWLFLKRKNHGWPLRSYETLTELERHWEERGLKAYRVRGISGLDGFVIAEKVEYQMRTRD